ncbi:urease accessory protein UreH domain-containing protein [Robertmurraya sp. P23]|uniref:urease accessory protein UreH domain-containing protein n=1 Tax=Robertmurraya sp. P23 TaxID=3436931 RepID=UPI003D991E5F
MVGLFTTISLGFLLGIKHAIEPDHVIAVSTVASQSKKIWRSSLIGVFWGIGHTATLLLTGVLMILLKGNIPEEWAMSLEFLVGIMLVYFGVTTFQSIKNYNKHTAHEPNQMGKRTSLKAVFMGFIHGLAGSAAMVLLTLSTVSTLWEGIVYILIFGLGTIVGMLVFTTIIGLPFIYSARKFRINKFFTQVTGVVSAIFGVYYMYNLGINEGLFHLWLQ